MDACLRGLIGERCALDSSRSLGMTGDITRAAKESIWLGRRRGFSGFLRVSRDAID